ncbi:MAG: molecular chaperone HtpG [Clostridiales bacterium]|nr:molecular chaperone HtpG [Clostridiales bacterium]
MKQFKAESKKLLDLVVNSIYTNREIFLRELISNASDAIDKRKFLSLTDASLDTDFCIELKPDKAARTLTVTDNGIGMDEKELENNLGVIAASGTERFKKEKGKETVEGLIGQFGVGFYSAFMVADKVTVVSRKIGEKTAHVWESDGSSGFEITEGDRAEAGTTVVLHLKEDGDENYSCYLESNHLKTLVKKYSDYIRYPIRMLLPKKAEGVEKGEVYELTDLNSMVPVWKKRKNELGESELDDFYMHTYHDFTPPILTIQTHIEGAVEYTALLYVPSEPAFDYYTKDYKRGLSLYCNGVLVMDVCSELVPEYLGFVRGVTDTPDLALNISRETLQHDRRLRAIATGLEKKILAELEKLKNTDREKYEKFFGAFGKALKFGAYDNYGINKDKLKDLLLYYSDAQKKNITLKEYCASLKEGEAITYACGETVEKIAMLPQLEALRADNRDVLYFTDVVDEFIARMLGEYDGHKFENVASGTVNGNAKADGHESLIKRIEEKLKGKAAVMPTDKLKSYPVCLAAKGDISLEMERVMSAMGGVVKAERVLQVNLTHPAIVALETADEDTFTDAVTVLYNEALLAEGYKTEPEFLSALNRIIVSGIGAAAPQVIEVEPIVVKKKTSTKSAGKSTKKPSQKSTAKKSVDGKTE